MEHACQIVLALILWQFMVSEGMQKCPESTEDWGRASMALQCKDPNYYHCLKDENGRITQQCLQRVWIQESMCPEFNFKARRIDVYQCKSNENNCPTTTYWSNAVYIYPGCFNDISSVAPKTSISFSILFTTTAEITTKDSDSTKNTSTVKDVSNGTPNILIIIIPCVIGILVFLFLGLVGIIVFKRRRRSESPGLNNAPDEGERPNQSSETENMLQDSSGLNNAPDGEERSTQSAETESMLQDSRQNPGLELQYFSTTCDEKLIDLVNKLKEIKLHRVVLILSHSPVEESKIEEEAKILGENVAVEDDFKLWKTNKSKRMYVFKDWMLSDKEECFAELKLELVEILQAVVQNDTKFIINFPLSVWLKDSTKLPEILRDCAIFKYRYYTNYGK